MLTIRILLTLYPSIVIWAYLKNFCRVRPVFVFMFALSKLNKLLGMAISLLLVIFVMPNVMHGMSSTLIPDAHTSGLLSLAKLCRIIGSGFLVL
eukprot:scaffold306135_cov17-Tisochrysis_lutea.AAC.1